MMSRARILDWINDPNCDPAQVSKFVVRCKLCNQNCDRNLAEVHSSCIERVDFEGGSSDVHLCQNAFVSIVVDIITTKPKILDDQVTDSIVACYKTSGESAGGFLMLDHLRTLHKSSSPTMSWLKFENLLIRLIKEQVYDATKFGTEALGLVKHEMPDEVAGKFSSLLGACVPHCRAQTKLTGADDDGTWCEIIDWMSWFLGSADSGDL